VVDALDKKNEFLNFLQIRGYIVDPNLKNTSIELVQTAPGRYEATIENAEASGNYFVNLGYQGPDKVRGFISTGVSVPYSDEYRELRSNPTTLETLASVTDGQVVLWKLLPDGRIDLERTVRGVDHFRRDASLINPRSFAALWPILLWLAACLFLGDVAVRRVALDIDWIKHTLAEEWKKLRGTETATASEYMDKLRSRKAEVDEQLDRPRSAARAETSPILFPDQPAAGPIGEPLLEGGSPQDRAHTAQKTEGPSIAAGSPETVKQSYTDRLLKAKQRVWEEREKDKEPEKKEPKP
jgi:hypothetical protein